MNYLLAKQDLATFNDQDINTLAAHYNVGGDYNDRLWQLALLIHGVKRAGMDSGILVIPTERGDVEIDMTGTVLDLQGNEIDDDEAAALADALRTNTNLTQLYLGGNNIGDDGATALAEALKENTTITLLYLSKNNIGGNGAAALADALKVNTTLTRLVLVRNDIGDDGAAAFLDALKVNPTLTTLGVGPYRSTSEINEWLRDEDKIAERKENAIREQEKRRGRVKAVRMR